MATQDDEFKHLYETSLKPKLALFEPQRKKIAMELFFGLTTLIALAIMLLFVVLTTNMGGLIVPLIVSLIVLIPIFFLGLLFYYAILVSRYNAKFKKEVMNHIVTYVDENLTYYPERMITRAEFQKSLFEKYWRYSIDIWSGEDYIEGILGFTEMKFSEIRAKHEILIDHKGDSLYKTIFKGPFFIFDFHKDFEGFLVVLPKRWDPFKLAYRRGPGERINLAEPELKQEFIVYSDNKITACDILSTSLMRRLHQFRRDLQKPVYLSFVNGTLYLGISLNKNLFEPRIFRTLLDYNSIREFSEYMQLAKDIVEELNLNTRIWSKGIVKKSQETGSSIRFKKSDFFVLNQDF
jgi:hypothetical protein